MHMFFCWMGKTQLKLQINHGFFNLVQLRTALRKLSSCLIGQFGGLLQINLSMNQSSCCFMATILQCTTLEIVWVIISINKLWNLIVWINMWALDQIFIDIVPKIIRLMTVRVSSCSETKSTATAEAKGWQFCNAISTNAAKTYSQIT